MNRHIAIIGAGIFGITAARTLLRRGYKVTLFDPGPIPHPLAASTDISKIVRMEYGSDVDYMAMAEEAIAGWHVWNNEFEETLYHEIGVSMLAQSEMQPGDFEHDSFQNLLNRGHQPVRLDAAAINRRFPAWKANAYVDGFYHAKAGYARSGHVVERIFEAVKAEGVNYVSAGVRSIHSASGRVTGLVLENGDEFNVDRVLVAAGAWSSQLVPELSAMTKVTGHPVFHLEPSDLQLFCVPQLAVFTADVAKTGWYGFPVQPGAKVLKIANHGIGASLHPTEDPRVVTAEDERMLRVFLQTTFPALVDAPVVYTRRCLYCDTLDEHFLIDRHPDIDGLHVATGGSGHGFKFAPILGSLIADAIDDTPNPWLSKFRWRSMDAETSGEEAARYRA